MNNQPSHDTTARSCLIAGLPVAAPEQAALLADLSQWASTVINVKQDRSTPLNSPTSADDLALMLIHSRHLQGLAKRHKTLIPQILNGDGESVIRASIAGFRQTAQQLFETADDLAMMAAIRRLRQQTALAIALGDLSSQMDVADQMKWLSETAEIAVQNTVHYLLCAAAKRNLMPEPADDLGGCGWSILALGKLGAAELNYSSDVDLIILHDPVATPLFEPERAQTFYVEMTRSLVKLLSHVTADGIGWRVDLRLRPDPGATAVSIQREAALGYYESIARTWERAAFIRARPIAGDIAFGTDFLREIQPFIWRRTLDYTVMDDMKTMLRRPRHGDGWSGFDLKTGENGIRKIEFLTHVLQLVAGGRSPHIRCGSTQPALVALAGESWISNQQAEALGHLYLGLRQVEHRLQMLADAQTHSLPRSPAEMTSLAHFLGWPDSDGFLRELKQHLDAVGTNATHHIFDDDPLDGGSDLVDDNHAENQAGAIMIPPPMLEDEDAFADWVGAHGFTRPQDITATISGWMAGRIAATRSERARVLLNRLAPDMLVQLASASNPDEAFGALAQFIEGLPASVQIFSLLDHNRHLTKLLCDMLILSPRMALYLRYFPSLFDLVLFKSFFATLPTQQQMKDQMAAAIKGEPIEIALQIVQQKAREWRFQIEVQALSGIANQDDLAVGLTAVADSVIAMVLQMARRDMKRRHGTIAGHIGIIGLGRLGVRSLTAQSDLDLIVVYDIQANDLDTIQSDGARPIGPTSYYTRLTQTFINWMGMVDVAGRFNDVDMRLRPDGDKGSLAVQASRLASYYQSEAWLWERLAIAKARVIATSVNDLDAGNLDTGNLDAGTPYDETPSESDFEAELTALLARLSAAPVPTAKISEAVCEMRERLRMSYGDAPLLQLRKQPGGLSELDLLVQGLRVAHTSLFTGTGQTPSQIIETLLAAEMLSEAHASDLLRAEDLFSRTHHFLRLCLGTANRAPDNLPAAIWRFLLTQMDMPDAKYLLGELANARAQITEIFDELLGP